MDTASPAPSNELLQILERENHELRIEVARLAVAEDRNRAAIAELVKQVQEIGLKADDTRAKCIVLRQTSLRNAGWRLAQIYELTEMILEYVGVSASDLRNMRMVCRDFRHVIDNSTTLQAALFWHPGLIIYPNLEQDDNSTNSCLSIKHNPDFAHKFHTHPPPNFFVRSRTLNFTYDIGPGSGVITFVWVVDKLSAAMAPQLPAVALRTFLTQPALPSKIVVKFRGCITLQRHGIRKYCKKCRRKKKRRSSCICGKITTSAIIEKEAIQEACVDVLPASVGDMLKVASAMVTVNPGPVLPREHIGESSWTLRGVGNTSLDPRVAMIMTSEPQYSARWESSP
jgi:hypothetical protein